jgi:hypothetical protein
MKTLKVFKTFGVFSEGFIFLIPLQPGSDSRPARRCG